MFFLFIYNTLRGFTFGHSDHDRISLRGYDIWRRRLLSDEILIQPRWRDHRAEGLI